MLFVYGFRKVTIGDIMITEWIFWYRCQDEWKSIVRQLPHSSLGRIVLYRDTLTMIGCYVYEAYRLLDEKKSLPKNSNDCR